MAIGPSEATYEELDKSLGLERRCVLEAAGTSRASHSKRGQAQEGEKRKKGKGDGLKMLMDLLQGKKKKKKKKKKKEMGIGKVEVIRRATR